MKRFSSTDGANRKKWLIFIYDFARSIWGEMSLFANAEERGNFHLLPNGLEYPASIHTLCASVIHPINTYNVRPIPFANRSRRKDRQGCYIPFHLRQTPYSLGPCTQYLSPTAQVFGEDEHVDAAM